jgi:hypothetical protein
VTPLLLAAAGVVALGVAGLVLRTFGPRYRIARLIATTPRVSVAEATELAARDPGPYVRVDGRIDSDQEFEGPDHQPLVFRRVRLEARDGRRWRAFEDHRQVVPFTVNEGLDAIAVDVEALDRGLVVVERESVGTAADLVERVPAGTAPDTPVRARIEQVSSVEHAIVLGRPVLAAAGRPVLTATRTRPLVLTILEPAEAMRVIAADGRRRTRLAAGLLAAGAILLLGALIWGLATALLPAVIQLAPLAESLVSTAFAASPEPSLAPGGGDPRSNGQGPGLVGTPGLAMLGVALIAILAIVATTIYVRITTPADDHEPRPGRRPGGGRGGRRTRSR